MNGDESIKGSEVVTKLLPEQGPFLPVPDENGEHWKIGDLERWNLRREKELGEIRKRSTDSNLAEWVSIVLGEMCSTLGPHDLKAMGREARRLLFCRLPMPNILYLYTWLRLHALGHEVRLKLECPFHEYRFNWIGDLRTLKVKVPTRLKDASWDFQLLDPFLLRGEEAKGWRCGPALWSSMESSGLGRRMNPGKLKSVMIHATIQSVTGRDITIAESELEEMSKRDLERHLAAIEEHAVGPDFSIEARCDNPKCERQFATSLDWSYDSFFASSSP